MRVLGIDPGLTRCGFGIVDVDARRKPSMIFVDAIGTSPDTSLDKRILAILEAAEEVLEGYNPDVLAVERVFSAFNVATVMGTAQAAGVVIGAAAKRGIQVALHTPTEVKATVTGDGQAGKSAVTKMVTKILGLTAAPHPADAADALALAITYAWRGGATEAPTSRVGAAARAFPSTKNGRKTAAQLKWEEALKARRLQ